MTGKLITNENTKLAEKIRNVIPHCKELSALVGYFYFSGFQELSKDIQRKNLRILVGMDVDVSISNQLKEVCKTEEIYDDKSDVEIRKDYYQKLTKLVNETEFFDNTEKEYGFKLFLSKIKNGTLLIRKTRKPNHAKLYLFQNDEEHNENGDYKGIVITGSSNFSYSGLAGRNEVNVIFRDNRDFEEAENLFNRLWNDSVDIVNQYNKDDFFTEVVQKIWMEKIPKPYLLFIRALIEYFNISETEQVKLPYEITKKRFFNLKYQSDAISKAVSVIRKHNGVIIADVVGLGKSVISSAVAHNLNMKTIVIAPPHLKDQWETYRMQFFYNAQVFSTGAIDHVFDKVRFDEEYLVIIDEAARFRNENTKDYALLHKLCQGNKVMLLTATPFNNKPEDIFSLLKLFQIPAKSTIRTVQNLAGAFKELVKEYKELQKRNRANNIDEDTLKVEIQKISDKIRDIIFPVVIRRTRLDLKIIDEYRKDLEKQNVQFAEIDEPKIAQYDLGRLAPLYEATTEEIDPRLADKSGNGFIGARYNALSYLKKEALAKMKEEMTTEEYRDIEWLIVGQRNIASFMRTLLVRRFESSIAAFRKTMDSMLTATENMKAWYEKGKIPVRKKGNIPDVETLLAEMGEEQELITDECNEALDKLKEKGCKFFTSSDISDDFVRDLDKDIALLKHIKKKWEKIDHDPKLESFSEIIKEQLSREPKRKIILFSEFSDTVNYLYSRLRYGLRVMKYTSADATKENKRKIEQNFDAGLEEELQKDDFDILLATDAISEGYNLHRAGTIFNYDIPYNPTRVIQRVGRINRINKKMFESLYIYNYFPTEKGERETGIKTISTFKMAMIHALVGEDTKILTSDEEINHYFAEKLKREKAAEDEESWDAKYRNMLYHIEKFDQELFKTVKDLPARSRVRRTTKLEKSGILLFGRKGDECSFRFSESDGAILDITTEQAFRLMETDLLEDGAKVSDSFDFLYQNLKNYLFQPKSSSKGEKKQTSTLETLKALIKTNPGRREYLKELTYTISTLKALPEQYMKMIRDIEAGKEDEGIKVLKKEVPMEYLLKLRKKAREIDGGKEAIILAEELG